MPDPTPATSTPDLSTYVPKSDYEKAIKSKEQELANLKSKIDEQALALLDTEYIEWKSNKGKAPAKQEALDTKDPYAERLARMEDALGKMQAASADAEARQELRETQARFSDWAEYLDDIKAFYRAQPDSNASYEQVYRYVKSLKLEKAEKEKDPKSKDKAKAPDSEKPGGVSPAAKALEQKEFKTTKEANAATIAELKDKFPDLGSTI